MSFKPIRFTYTPPPTVLSSDLGIPNPVNQPPKSVNPLDSQTVADQSSAAALIGRLSDLKDTSQYLQQAILARCDGMGVSLNYAADPELAESLKRLYPNTELPSGITIAMYNQLLAAEFGMMRADMVLANSNSSLQTSPYQRIDLTRATQCFEDAMCSTGDFVNQLPLLLRELQGNDLVYDSLSSMLAEYPVVADSSYATAASNVQPPVNNYQNDEATDSFSDFAALGQAVLATPTTLSAASAQLSAIDCSESLFSSLSQRLDTATVLVGHMYNTVVGVNSIVTNANALMTSVSALVGRAIGDVATLMGACLALKASFHKPTLLELKNSLTMMVLPRLIGEVGKLTGLMDRMLQKVTAPVTNILFGLDATLVNLTAVESNIAYMVDPNGLTSTIKSHITGSQKPPVTDAVTELSSLQPMIQKLGGYLAWGQLQIARKQIEVQKSLMQHMDRSQQLSGSRLDILQTLSELDSITGILKSLILQTNQVVSEVSATASPANGVFPTLQEGLGQVVGSLQAQTGAQFAFVGDGTKLLQIPPKIPVPSAAVSAVLVQGGATLLPTASLNKVL